MPLLMKPRMVTATKTTSASATVTAMWLVVAKDIGNSPSRLENRMNRNKVMI